MSKKNMLKKIEEVPLSDDMIKKYLPECKIITNKDLSKYNSIDELFGNNNYIIILFLNSPNSGHWISLIRYNNVIEYFDPYGNDPKKTYDYVDDKTTSDLGIEKYYLDELLKNSGYNVLFNNFKYQSLNQDQNSCGRHSIFRILCGMKGMSLPAYYLYMQNEKKKNKDLSFDDIVSKNIDIIN